MVYSILRQSREDSDGKESMRLVRFTGTGEWSALYDADTDNLVTYGDHYIVEDKIAELLGVEVVDSDLFVARKRETGLLGQKGFERESALPRLGNVRAAISHAEQQKARADDLREQAARLMLQAEELEA